MKELGQVFTPITIVKQILNLLNYKENCINKKVLEPSFGEGVFLMEIIQQLIEKCIEEKMSKEQIIKQLENNIYGIEIDKSLYEKTLKSINGLLDKYHIKASLHLYNIDALDFNQSIKFDYIIGNPPYIRIHKLDDTTKNKIKSYKFATGNTDLYIVFYELGINLLNQTGKLGYIAPNSYFKNTSQKAFRNYLLDNKLITTIIDFKSNKIFKDADTYTAITILDKSNKIEQLNYTYNTKSIFKYSELYNKPWSFYKDSGKTLLSSICNAQHGLATNADKIFISKIVSKTKATVMFNDFEIEKSILKPIIKGSKYNGEIIDTYIIFPYKKEKDRYIPLSESQLKENYPLTYQYLLANKENLEKRNLEKNAVWFQFARSQSINTLDKDKLVIKHIVSNEAKEIQYYYISSGVFVYSGVYITSNNLKKVEDIINTEPFLNYCKSAGKDMSGGYKSVSAKMIKEYKF